MDLTANLLRETFTYSCETGQFTRVVAHRRDWIGRIAGSINGHGYVVIRIGKRAYAAHRLAWLYVHGEWPAGHIDHINGNKTDNRIANLRVVSPSESNQNWRKAMPTNKVGLLGVSFDDRRKVKKYRALIQLGERRIFIGAYATADEAHQAYIAVKRNLHPANTL